MAVRSASKQILPRSHVFITVAHGGASRTFATRSGFAAAAAAVLPLLLLWFVGSTFFLVFHDDLVTSLMLRERDMQYGYEDRIATLHREVERATSHQLLTQRAIETKLDELTRREAELQGRSGIMAQLENQAAHLAGVSAIARATSTSVQPTGALSFAPTAESIPVSTAVDQGVREQDWKNKPHPEAADRTPAGGRDPARAAGVPDRVSDLSTGLDDIETSQQNRVATLDAKVRVIMAHYHDALNAAGVSESRLSNTHREIASGGPFVPLTAVDDGTPFARSATSVQLSLSQAEQLSAAIKHVPFNRPLLGDPEITSPFGPRVDPFLGRAALHTGVDLSEDTGTEVRATAPGRVTVAGPVSGYGTMIEIDHGAGLTTRYAHLSETDVSVGQVVELGHMIGRVGSTGRATGPHLHYETRIDGEPVDPLRFMAAGQRLLVNLDKTL